MAARLRGGTLHSFDVSDWRAAEVKRAWLPNMHFHSRDLSGDWWHRSPDSDDDDIDGKDTEASCSSTANDDDHDHDARNCRSGGSGASNMTVAAAVRGSDLVFVDHIERLAFCEHIARSGWLRSGALVRNIEPERLLAHICTNNLHVGNYLPFPIKFRFFFSFKVLVHDFPYEEPRDVWLTRMGAVGCEQLLQDIAEKTFHSKLAAFQCNLDFLDSPPPRGGGGGGGADGAFAFRSAA